MDNTLKKSYRISRIIIPVITFIIFCVMFRREDSSWRILPFIFALIAFVVSFPSSIISKHLINFGDKSGNIIIKILYYAFVLPVLILFLIIGIYGIISLIAFSTPTSSELSEALGQVLTGLFFAAIADICLIVPYIQTLIVLILRKNIKESKEI